jgi:hypothetical protein
MMKYIRAHARSISVIRLCIASSLHRFLSASLPLRIASPPHRFLSASLPLCISSSLRLCASAPLRDLFPNMDEGRMVGEEK